MHPPFQNLDKLQIPPGPADPRAALERMLTALVEDYGAEKIIVFGSCVRGGVTMHSDVDLCVVREHPPGCTHPQLEALTVAGQANVLLSKDILVRTPAQFQRAAEKPFGVMDEVINHGLTVYER